MIGTKHLGGSELESYKTIKTINYTIYHDNQVGPQLVSAIQSIESQADALTDEGSGWSLDHVR